MLQRRRFLQLSSSVITLTPKKSKRSLAVDRMYTAGLPIPKFWFGDWVCETHVCNDDLDPVNLGRVYHDYGIVHGLSFYPDGSDQPGWVYLVYWKILDGQPAPPRYVDELRESLLSFSTPVTSGAPRCR